MITDPNYFPRVLQAVAGKDYQVFIYFDDGSIHQFDAQHVVKGEAFLALQDRDVFAKRLTVLNSTVAWDLTGNRSPHDCLDLDPLELYRTTPEVKEPLDLA